jgi:DeoR family transcriptional regulator, aga operon transcriptional repressor
MPVKTPVLLAEERRREIIRLLRKAGSVSVEDLVRRFNVSAVTLRADLGQLAERGLLIRSYGGAMVPLSPNDDVPLNVKRSMHHAEKIRIARAAAQLVKPRQTVILDSGTTSGEVAKAIKAASISPVTIITHALNIAHEFADATSVSVIMLGGLMRHVSGSFVGPQAERSIRELHADHFFLGVDGLDVESGLSTPDLLEAQLNGLMMQRSQEVTVIADASKFGRRSLSVISAINEVRRIITDDRAQPEALEKIRETGVEVLVV